MCPHFSWVPMRTILGSWSEYVFNVLNNCKSIFQRHLHQGHSQQHRGGLLCLQRPSPNLVPAVFWIRSHCSECIKGHLTVILICISLTTNAVHHLFYVIMSHSHVYFGEIIQAFTLNFFCLIIL